jgi:hypothetical protein
LLKLIKFLIDLFILFFLILLRLHQVFDLLKNLTLNRVTRIDLCRLSLLFQVTDKEGCKLVLNLVLHLFIMYFGSQVGLEHLKDCVRLIRYLVIVLCDFILEFFQSQALFLHNRFSLILLLLRLRHLSLDLLSLVKDICLLGFPLGCWFKFLVFPHIGDLVFRFKHRLLCINLFHLNSIEVWVSRHIFL